MSRHRVIYATGNIIILQLIEGVLLPGYEASMDLTHESDWVKLQDDTFHLTDNHVFFPELVWESVLSKINNPIDIKSCSNASPYFWQFLQKKRQSKVLAPIVLQQLSTFFNEYKSESKDDGSADENGKISMTHFWKLREVCKSWNTTLENLHQSSKAGHFRMKDDMETFEYDHLYSFAHDVFDPQALPQQFLDHFDPTHYDPMKNQSKKNPFLGRSVQFNWMVLGNPDDDEDQMYLHGIFEMLRKYGTEIWYAYFDFGDMFGTNLVEIYSRFVEFLKFTPNLKALRVDCVRENLELDDTEDDEQLEIEIIAERRRNLRRLRNQICRNPIPTLPHPELLWTTDLPTRMFNELLMKNRHISKLRVDRKVRHPDYSIFKWYLPNLTALGVTFSSLKAFEKFENCRIPFTLRKFYFRYDGPCQNLSWSRLFHALEQQLGKNCTELSVQMPSPKTEYQSIQTFDDTHFDRLNLLNLRQIEIMCDSTISLDFLLPTKHSLREIFVRYLNGNEDEFLLKRFVEYEEKQLVKFIGFKDRMEDSNIWKDFPMLEDLTLFRKKDMGGCVGYTSKRGVAADCILEKDRWYHETI